MIAAIALPVLLALAPTTPAPRTQPRATAPALHPVAACEAVTRLDVEAVVGHPVEGAKPQTTAGETTCDYISEFGQVTITFHRSTRKLNVAAEIENLTAAMPDGKVREVAGIGTKAFFMDLGDSGAQLHVVRGEHEYLLISVLGFGNASEVSAAAERLARKALAKL